MDTEVDPLPPIEVVKDDLHAKRSAAAKKAREAKAIKAKARKEENLGRGTKIVSAKKIQALASARQAKQQKAQDRAITQSEQIAEHTVQKDSFFELRETLSRIERSISTMQKMPAEAPKPEEIGPAQPRTVEPSAPRGFSKLTGSSRFNFY